MESYREHISTLTKQGKSTFVRPHGLCQKMIQMYDAGTSNAPALILVLAPALALVSGSAFAFADVFAWSQ